MPSVLFIIVIIIIPIKVLYSSSFPTQSRTYPVKRLDFVLLLLRVHSILGSFHYYNRDKRYIYIYIFFNTGKGHKDIYKTQLSIMMKLCLNHCVRLLAGALSS
jgi:hypothetical protein